VKFWSNLHQESWEKKVDLPNCWDNHKLCKWVGKSYKKLYYTEVITKACPLRCKITHTHTYYSHHWYIRTRLQCGHIFMMRYAKSNTHTSILLAGRRSCCTWSLNKLHPCWWLKQWSLDMGWNCSSWCQEVLVYLPWTQLRGRSMSQEFFSQLC
jgi:hypothetical protein